MAEINLSKTVERIRAKLGHLSLDWKPQLFLDTGVPDLNAVLGHREQGLAYGCFVEIAGWESQGKTALALCLAAIAQQQGALVVWADFERSFDINWATQRGLDVERMVVLKPYIGKFDGKKAERISTAQDLWDEIEGVIQELHGKYKGVLLVVDSIPAQLTEAEDAAGVSDQNMRTSNFELPAFLNTTLRRWMSRAPSWNTMGILINQLRNRPDKFNPVYSPGGNALRFYCHARARIARSEGKVIKRGGVTVGIQGIITNHKNKSGSPEGQKVAFKLRFGDAMEFLPAKELEKDQE